MDEGRIALDAKLMSTVIWSLALFRQFESPLYDDILRGLKQHDIGHFDQESVRRLYQVHLPLSRMDLKCSRCFPDIGLTNIRTQLCSLWGERKHVLCFLPGSSIP